MTIILIILLVLLIGGFAWPASNPDGPYYYRYGPSGLLSLLLVVLIVLLIVGVIPHGL